MIDPGNRMRRKRDFSCDLIAFSGNSTSNCKVRRQKKNEYLLNRRLMARASGKKKDKSHSKSANGVVRRCYEYEKLRAQTPDCKTDAYGTLKKTVLDLQLAIKTDTLEHYRNKARFDRRIRKISGRLLADALEIRASCAFEVFAKNRKIWKFEQPAFNRKTVKKLFESNHQV